MKYENTLDFLGRRAAKPLWDAMRDFQPFENVVSAKPTTINYMNKWDHCALS